MTFRKLVFFHVCKSFGELLLQQMRLRFGQFVLKKSKLQSTQ